MNTKKIKFDRYEPLWVCYECEVEISDEDYEKLENGDITLEEIHNNYEVEYGQSEITDNYVDDVESEYENWNICDEE